MVYRTHGNHGFLENSFRCTQCASCWIGCLEGFWGDLMASEYMAGLDGGFIIGVMWAKGHPKVVIVKNEDLAIGYRVTPTITLRGHPELLELMERLLRQHEIHSTISTAGLMILKKDSILKMVDLMIADTIIQLPKWNQFFEVLELYELGEHLTPSGFEEIVDILGV